ncbi:class I SAM-dependent methyltransferase [Amycolatopsis suaedae]|nr:class I SAM-dependent methyltransferase [Amycolatopsis suaedae]
MFQSRFAEIYDLLMRSRAKDYDTESAQVERVVRARNPNASSLLDVACGTGLHLRSFAERFDRAVGFDQSKDMLSVAQGHIAGLETRSGDMRHFDLGETFDVITCMFAVPLLQSVAELESMISCFLRHLNPNGVLVIEPWHNPEQFIPGYISSDLITDGPRKVYRVSHSMHHPDGKDRVHMVVHYVDTDPESGMQYLTETCDMTLFTREHYEATFAKVGCVAEHVQLQPFERGLWVAQRA